MITSALFELLKDRGLSASQLSAATGISKNTLSTFVTNSANGIRYDTLNKICNYLDVTPSDVLVYSPYDYHISIDPFTFSGDGSANIEGELIIASKKLSNIGPTNIKTKLYGQLSNLCRDDTTFAGYDTCDGYLGWHSPDTNDNAAHIEAVAVLSMFNSFSRIERDWFEEKIDECIYEACNGTRAPFYEYDEPLPDLHISGSLIGFIDEMNDYIRDTPTSRKRELDTLLQGIESNQRKTIEFVEKIQEILRENAPAEEQPE